MKIPFDIKFKPQIESGEYKVVCGGSCYPVFILMWDFKDPEGYCILGYYEDKEGQHAVMYNNSGKLYHDKESMFDLFVITPEPEPLTKLEKAVFDMLVERTNEATISEKQARKYAPIFLEIAKDEIYSHESLVEYAKKAKAEGKAEAFKEIEQDPESSYAFKRGFEYGKEEALKDLPRWKRAAASFGNYSIVPTETGALCLLIDGHYIMLSDLEKLPKDE